MDSEKDDILKGFKRFTFYCDEVALYRKMLTSEQIGELFCAVMQYVETGERCAVSSAIEFPYQQQMIAVDRAKEAYISKVEKNRANGSRGGKTKAAKSKKSKQEKIKHEPELTAPGQSQLESEVCEVEADYERVEKMLNTHKYQPPTEAELSALIQDICGDGPDAYDGPSARDLAYFYEGMTDNGWKAFGLNINTEADLRAALTWRYCLRWPIISEAKDKELFQNVVMLGYGSLDWSSKATEFLLEHYDFECRAFKINGTMYSNVDNAVAVVSQNRLVDFS